MSVIAWSVLFCLALLAGVLGMMEAGFRLGQRRSLRLGPESDKGLSAVDGAVFGLFGLLVAFTFSGAAQRFDERRQLVAQEANAIGTSWLRLDLLPAGEAQALRPLYRHYVESRLAVFAHQGDEAAARAAEQQGAALQQAIWERLVAARATVEPAPAYPLVISAANDMFDMVTTRQMASRMHPPVVIYALLAVAALLAALLAGVGMGYGKQRPLLQACVFAGIISLSVYVILDLEHPRLGLVRVDSADQVLIDLRASMGS